MLYVVVLCVLLGSVSVALAQSEDVPEVVTIGGIFDITGNWSLEGEESKSVAELAVQDFNAYLDGIGADWSLAMQVEDAQANASVALDKIQSLRSRGIHLFVGMGFSSHIQAAKSYIDSNDLLVISHGSQAANLAIPADAVFRLRPDDNNQAPVIAAMLRDAGIEVVATVNRGDTWGDGLIAGVADVFEGELIELFRYNPDSVDFSVEASILNDDLDELIRMHGADKVGVLYVGTNEFLLMIQQMAPYDHIDDVRWFSTNTQSGNSALVDDEQAFEFVRATQFTAVRSVSGANSIQEYVNEWVMENYGRSASIFAYPAYDSVWLLGTAIQLARTTDTDVLAHTIPMVARTMIGSSGHLELNDAGDLASGSYQIWHVTDSGWSIAAEYSDGLISGSTIPDWVQQTAEWWSAGIVDDDTFMQAIAYLIDQGIL